MTRPAMDPADVFSFEDQLYDVSYTLVCLNGSGKEPPVRNTKRLESPPDNVSVS